MSHYNLSEGALVGEDIRLWEAVETLMCGFLPCREQNDFFFLLGRASLSHGKDEFRGAFIHVAGNSTHFFPFWKT